MRLSCLSLLVLLLGCGVPPKQDLPRDPSSVDAEQKPDTKEIDALLTMLWTKEGVTPSPPADDAEFLRRVSLDLAGRIPTPEEVKELLKDKDPQKRERAVDRLLASPDYAEHWADVYMDLLIGTDIRRLAQKDGAPRKYLKDALASNKPYDQMVREMLTATGDVQENGASAFLVARGGKGAGPEAIAAATSRIFLGVQIQCAQCHDHPYDPRYKQEDFYGFVAYFTQTRAKRNKETKSFRLVDVPRGEAKMKKPGSEKAQKVSPKFLGRELSPKEGETRRQTLARAVVSSDLFAKAAVNRSWAMFFGRGIVEPWDDLGGENDANHPALLTQAAKEFAENGYDLKRLLRLLVLSDAYARSSRGSPGPESDPALPERVFARAAVRPLSPNQLFRSLLDATGVEDVAKERIGERKFEKMKERALKEYLFVFGDDEMAEVSTFDGNMPQALLLFNGEITNRGALGRAKESTLRKILEASSDRKERLGEIFLAVYGRYPNEEEQAELSAFLEESGDKRAAYEDLFFAMLSSTEFLTNH